MRIFLDDICKSLVQANKYLDEPCYLDCKMYEKFGEKACEERVLVLIWSTEERCEECKSERQAFIDTRGIVLLNSCDCRAKSWTAILDGKEVLER